MLRYAATQMSPDGTVWIHMNAYWPTSEEAKTVWDGTLKSRVGYQGIDGRL